MYSNEELEYDYRVSVLKRDQDGELGRRVVLSAELALKPEHIREVVARELGPFRCASALELRLHPEDAEQLGPTETLLQQLELSGHLTLMADPSMTRGGCVLTSNAGEADARLETRLEAAIVLLKDWNDAD